MGIYVTHEMNRVKALYRSWGIACEGHQVYAPRHRAQWLNRIGEAGVRRRAEFFYQQLDALHALRQAVRRDLLAESRKHGATKLLRQIPYIAPRPSGPLRNGAKRSSSCGRNVGTGAGGWMSKKYSWFRRGEVFFT